MISFQDLANIHEEGFNRLQEASQDILNQRRVESAVNVGICKIHGFGTSRNVIEGYQILFDIYLLGGEFFLWIENYLNQHSFPETEIEVFRFFKYQKNTSDVKIQTIIGLCYQYGFGVLQDFNEAYKWLEAAAIKRYAPAQYFTALFFANLNPELANGIGVFQYYQMAAGTGLPCAQYKVGCRYLMDIGSETNLKEGFLHLHLSADSGYVPALNMLGKLYETGIPSITPINIPAAARCFVRASEQHDKDAKTQLARLRAMNGERMNPPSFLSGATETMPPVSMLSSSTPSIRFATTSFRMDRQDAQRRFEREGELEESNITIPVAPEFKRPKFT